MSLFINPKDIFR